VTTAQLQAESVSYHLRALRRAHAFLRLRHRGPPRPRATQTRRRRRPHIHGHRPSAPSLTPRGLFLRALPRVSGSPLRRTRRCRVQRGEPPRAPSAVWTTGMWEREGVGMCWAEARLVELHVEGMRERRDALKERFVRRALDSGNRAEKAEGEGVSYQIRMRCERRHSSSP